MSLKNKKKRNKIVTEKQLSNNSNSFFIWIQEFSKKIVSITFFIYVIINIFVLAMLCLQYYNSGELGYIDTIIAETNQTFRDVIGGYIIKAATENAIKIAGSVITKYMDYRLYKKYGIETDCNDEDEIPDEEA